MVSVVLVNPPQRPGLGTFSEMGLIAPPMGLAYIAAVLEQYGCSVGIIDSPAQGITFSGLREALGSVNPDVVGVTASTATFREAVGVSLIADEVCPEASVVIGGPHVSFTPEKTLRESPSIDIVCVGEGEGTFLKLIQALEEGGDLSNVKGIAYRERKGEGCVVKRNPPRPLIEDLDSLPFPARHLLPMDRYRAMGRRVTPGTVLTSRGCPFGCIFCSTSKLFGGRFRGRSPGNVVREVELLYNRYKTRDVEFLDDLFTYDRGKAIGIC